MSAALPLERFEDQRPLGPLEFINGAERAESWVLIRSTKTGKVVRMVRVA